MTEIQLGEDVEPSVNTTDAQNASRLDAVGKDKGKKREAKRTRVVSLVFLAVIIVAIAATLFVRRDRDDATLVRTVEAGRTTITSRVLAQGRLRARAQVEVTSEVSGRVVAVFVKEGDIVKEGDPLFAVDDEQQRNVVAQLEVASRATRTVVDRAMLMLDEARRQLERDVKLKERGVMADDTFLSAKNRLPLAEADLTSAKTQAERAALDLARARDALRKSRVAAPQAGTVVAVDIEVGEVVVPGIASSSGGMGLQAFGGGGGVSSSNGVVIADLTELKAELDVDELDIGLVKVGQPVLLKSQGGVSFRGTVVQKGLLGRESGGTVSFDVDVSVNAPSSTDAGVTDGPQAVVAELRPGMSVTGDIEVATLVDAIAVPMASVLEGTGDESDRLIVVTSALEGDVAAVRQVTLGASDAEHVAVLSGIESGDVVIEGPFRALKELKDGDAVNIESTRKLHEKADRNNDDGRDDGKR